MASGAPAVAAPTHDARRPRQILIGAAAVGLGVAIGVGAWSIPGAAGYAGVGPNFLPWVVALALLLCGALLLREALTGGWRELEAPSGAPSGDWPAFAWVAAGVLATAALITTIGFVLACTLCFTLAVRGLRASEGRAHGGAIGLARDCVTGALIAAPAYWLFTKLLAINLPGLVPGGWI
jgi:putative tricarboxylic transport membrane protein